MKGLIKMTEGSLMQRWPMLDNTFGLVMRVTNDPLHPP